MDAVVKPKHPWISTALFAAVHVVAVAGVVWMGWSWSGVALALGLYFARMFFVTAGYHRYFSHRAYKTSRPFQLLLAIGAETSAQKGVLWWAAHHRTHHKYSDTPDDPHSPKHYGFWWSHVGWVVSSKYEDFDPRKVPDLARYPELGFLNQYWMLPVLALAGACFAFGGLHGLLWGFFVSTTLLWHGTFTINSLTHLIGRQRYESGDDSKNHWLLALITMGEGWHNNHHYYQSTANQGFFWWEIDASYYVLRVLSAVGLVRDLRTPSARIKAGAMSSPHSREPWRGQLGHRGERVGEGAVGEAAEGAGADALEGVAVALDELDAGGGALDQPL